MGMTTSDYQHTIGNWGVDLDDAVDVAALAIVGVMKQIKNKNKPKCSNIVFPVARNKEELAFFCAIAADPDNNLHRLVYADWLEENGEADRAEFIRQSCKNGLGEYYYLRLYPEWFGSFSFVARLYNINRGFLEFID